MLFTKKILIATVSVTLVFVVGCGSQETSRNEETKPAVEQKADTQELQPQKDCPVMGGQIDKSLYVDKDGKRIYICCGHCREELTKNFDEHVKKLAELGQKPELL